MIDISHKRTSLRYARASGKVFMPQEIIEIVRRGEVPKGNVAEIARSAGIQAGKRTSEWIVFCHSLPVDWLDVEMSFEEDGLRFTAEARTVWKTGLEMEVMTAVSAALINAYDMLKPLKSDIEIGRICLEEKRGGKSDMRDDFDPPLRAAVFIVSTAKKRGDRPDTAGTVIRDFMEDHPIEIVHQEILPEEPEVVEHAINAAINDNGVDLVFLSGGTGPAEDDFVPGIIKEISDRMIPGIGEAMRQHGFQRTPFAMLSSQVAGVLDTSLVVSLPGSSRGAEESLHALLPGLLHIFPMMRHT